MPVSNASVGGRPRKVHDDQLIRLVNLGLSKVTIAGIFDCHAGVVANRLKELGIVTPDERKSFIEAVYAELSVEHQEWLMNKLSQDYTIREYIRDLMMKHYEEQKDVVDE